MKTNDGRDATQTHCSPYVQITEKSSALQWQPRQAKAIIKYNCNCWLPDLVAWFEIEESSPCVRSFMDVLSHVLQWILFC